MNDLKKFFSMDFPHSREEWAMSLKSELKLEDVTSKTTKKHIDLGPWPTLSTSASQVVSIPANTPWKKASQTYFKIDSVQISTFLNEDLENGVRSFYFHAEYITSADWAKIEQTFHSFHLVHEIEVFLLGAHDFSFAKNLNVVTLNKFLTADFVHHGGGHNVQELAYLTCQLIEALPNPPTHVGVYVDSHFFKNIAKIRALKLMINKFIKFTEYGGEIKVVALNSYREWTLFERYSNMLRNNAQVASAYIGGADSIQSSGYQVLFDIESDVTDSIQSDRSRRMARNTSHILSLESMLGIVEDSSYGSFHLEELTQSYAAESWALMQQLLKRPAKDRATWLQTEVHKISEERLLRLKTRKDILTGINDFPDGKERLLIQVRPSGFFRTARPFELMRLKIESMPSVPSVEILYHGDISLLNARVSFIKNYFELLGLEVLDPSDKPTGNQHSILVLCAKDEDYPELTKKFIQEKCVARYIAGKVEHTGFESIYSGQNIFDLLSRLVLKLEGDK